MNKIHPEKHILLCWRPVVEGCLASEQDPPASDFKIFKLEFKSNHFRRWNAVAYYCSSPSEETKEEQSPSTPVMIRVEMKMEVCGSPTVRSKARSSSRKKSLAAAMFRSKKRGGRTAVLWSPKMEALGCHSQRPSLVHEDEGTLVWGLHFLVMECVRNKEPDRCFSLADNW
ncbi:hypothetical protein U1Q18_030711 [Sarracenia purpurea var. burkii]